MRNKLNGLLLAMLFVTFTVLTGCNAEKANGESNKGATDYPTKPIKIINPFSAGGSADNTSRILGQHAQEFLGESVVIENRDGGGGTIGQTAGAKAKNDGYTLTLMTSSIVGNALYNNVSFKVDDFEPIIMVVNDPIYLIAGKDAPYDTLEEFVDYAKAHPGEINVGVNGTQTNPAISNRQVSETADIEVATIPFDGESLALAAVAGGHVDVMYGGYSAFESQLHSGNVKVLTILSEERSEELPDIPTAIESGIDVVSTSWRGIGAPKGTDPEIIKILHEGFKQAVESDAYNEQMKKVGINLSYGDPEKFQEVIDQSVEIYENYGQ